jgi:hypothetical protein
MSGASPEIVDLDEESSWPEAVRTFVADQAQRLAGSTEFATDLSSEPIERDEEFHSLFPGRRLLAFHATSLFEHEIADIRRNGLRPLSLGLVAQKIDDAHARGEISTLVLDHCLARNVYAIDNVAGREGRICLVVGRSIFDRNGGGLTPFLGGWGGESMNGGPEPHDDPVLQTLGRPSIVVATVDLGVPGNRPYAAPSLPKVFVGKRLGLEDAFGELHVTVNIRGEHILDIWHPGDPDYDRHLSLPGKRASLPARQPRFMGRMDDC